MTKEILDRLDPIQTEDQLVAKCAYWQKVLRLQDWAIRVQFAKRGEISGQGQVRVVEDSASALIKITRYEDYTTSSEMRDPIEKTLIHELIHVSCWYVHASEYKMEKTEHVAWEQMIDKTAWALLEQHYDADPGQLNAYQTAVTMEEYIQ